MFCPRCGLEDRQSNQFCRACGADLRPVRLAIERPADNVTASAASARDEIGRAFAARIREVETARELEKVAEDVLPEIEKFLESPEEKRMRRIRTGTLISFIGMGVAIAFAVAGLVISDEDVIVVAGLGVITFFIGLSFIVNALFFTVPRKSLPADKAIDAQSQRALDLTAADAGNAETNELLPPPTAESGDVFSSVTEHTTQHLREKQAIRRD